MPCFYNRLHIVFSIIVCYFPLLLRATRYWTECYINALTTFIYVFIEYLLICYQIISHWGHLETFCVAALTFMVSAWWCYLPVMVWLTLEFIELQAWFVLCQLVCFSGSQSKKNVKSKGGSFDLDDPFSLVHLFVFSVLY